MMAVKNINQKINVAHLIGSLGMGGAEQQVVQLLNHLDESLFNKHVIVLWNKTTGFKKNLNQNINYFSLQYRRRYMPLGIGRLLLYLKSQKIDVLHTHMYDPNKIGAIVGRLAKIPVIVTSEHGKNPWKKRRHRFVEKQIIDKLTDKRIAVSKDIRFLRITKDGINPRKIITIPNGIPVNKYQAKINHNHNHKIIIGCLGRLIEAKDYFSMFKAVKILKEKSFNVELHVAGDGHLKSKLREYIFDNGMEDTIKLLGFKNAEQFFKKIDIFVISSIREGMPVALLEAMSCGLPVAATKVGGILELIYDGYNGLLSEPKQPEELSKNIETLINDPDLCIRFGENARNTIIEKYDIKKIAGRFGKLYLKLLFDKKVQIV